MKTLRILMVLPIVLAVQNCLIVDHEDPGCIGASCGVTLGDIEFFWAFEMSDGSATDWCYDAEVANLDLYIYDDVGRLEFQALNRPCEDLGAIIDNFYPGSYELELEAICRSGALTHYGSWYLDVFSGSNDYGTLTLSYLGPCL